MKCPTCGSIVPDVHARCADCGKETNQFEQGKLVYCGSCGGKRKLKARASKARKPKASKAVRPVEDKGA